MHRRIQPAVGARLSGRYDWVTGGAPVLGTTRLASLVANYLLSYAASIASEAFPAESDPEPFLDF